MEGDTVSQPQVIIYGMIMNARMYQAVRANERKMRRAVLPRKEGGYFVQGTPVISLNRLPDMVEVYYDETLWHSKVEAAESNVTFPIT